MHQRRSLREKGNRWLSLHEVEKEMDQSGRKTINGFPLGTKKQHLSTKLSTHTQPVFLSLGGGGRGKSVIIVVYYFGKMYEKVPNINCPTTLMGGGQYIL